MRDIKFRAWMKPDKVMLSHAELMSIPVTYHDVFEGNSKYQCMQYTGLKDKINKNEVYEHDIINHINYGFLKVEWDYKDTGWICLDKNFKKYYLTDVLLLGGIKVGNIYENPTLLNP